MSKLIAATSYRLNQQSREVAVDELMSPSIQNVIRDMYRVANINSSGRRENPSKSTLVGLAAPQIGKMLRIILVDIGVRPEERVTAPDIKLFINPRIIESSEEENLFREGCYSTNKICGAVYRSNMITISAIDEMGKEFVFKSSNIMQARILQHEVDHLNGIRFPSRVRDLAHLHIVEAGDNTNYRENWREWPNICPIETWLRIYNGKK